MGASISQILARAALLPGVLDLRSSTKKETPKLKFPERKEKKFVPKVYAKGSGTRKVNE